MKKILIVNTHYKTGGIKTSLDHLIRFLSEDHAVDILFLNPPEKDAWHWADERVRMLPVIKPLDAYFIDGREIKNKKRGKLRYYFYKLLFKAKRMFWGSEKVIKQIIDKQKPTEKYDVAIAYSHDHWTNGGFSGGCNYYVLKKAAAARKYAWIHGEHENIGLDRERALATYSGFDKVISVSKSCDDKFKELVGGAVPSDFIYNLFDADEIRKKATEPAESFDEGVFTIVTVGRIHPVKRIDKVNVIAKRLKEAGYDFRWIVVGGGPLLNDYMKEAADLGLEGKVIYTGEQKNPYRYIGRSDVFVLLSDSESFSIVINEALILNVPVISTEFPAVYETIDPGKNGWIVGKTTDEMYDAIVYCMQHPEELQAMKEYLRDHPRGRYLEENSASKISALLTE